MSQQALKQTASLSLSCALYSLLLEKHGSQGDGGGIPRKGSADFASRSNPHGVPQDTAWSDFSKSCGHQQQQHRRSRSWSWNVQSTGRACNNALNHTLFTRLAGGRQVGSFCVSWPAAVGPLISQPRVLEPLPRPLPRKMPGACPGHGSLIHCSGSMAGRVSVCAPNA